MPRDTLFLLQPGFADPKHPGVAFACPHCTLLEGLLAAAPERAGQLDVVRVPFPRPRQAVIDLVGEAHQSLPLLVLGDAAPADAQVAGERRFLNQSARIAAWLAERHGFPVLHG